MGRSDRSNSRKRKQPGADGDDAGEEAGGPSVSDEQVNGGGPESGAEADGTGPDASPVDSGTEGATAGEEDDVAEVEAEVAGTGPPPSPSAGAPATDSAAAAAAVAEPAPPPAAPAAAPAAPVDTRRRTRKSSAAAAAAVGVPDTGAAAPAAEEQSRGRPTRQRAGTGGKYKESNDAEKEAGAGKDGGKQQQQQQQRRKSGAAKEKEKEKEKQGAAAAAGGRADEEDAWDTHCKVCGSAQDAPKLLCCEGQEQLGCTAVYHMYCLDPPLTKLPAGEWFCPECAHKYSYQDIERILDFRDVPASSRAVSPALPRPSSRKSRRAAEEAESDVQVPPLAPSMRREFYAKWKGESYIHCTWEPEEEMAKMYRIFPAIKQKVQRFWRQREVREAEDREAEEAGEFHHGVSSQWIEVDRILAEQPAEQQPAAKKGGSKKGGGGGGGGGGSGVGGRLMEYLVKWKDLGYDQCTWEAETDLSGYEGALKRFREAKSVADDARARKAAAAAAAKDGGPAKKKARREEPAAGVAAGASTDEVQVQGSGTRKWHSTPDFLSGGTLHPYQLEGLNWLYHKYCTGDAVILADEMGLGKTVQTIAFLASLHADFCELPHLVVVPLSTMRNWEREFAAWAPALNVVSLAGNADARSVILEYELFVQPQSGGSKQQAGGKRAAAADDGDGGGGGSGGGASTAGGSGGGKGDGGTGGTPAGSKQKQKGSQQDRAKFHVLLTSYEMLALEAGPLSKLQYGVLVVDEGHRLKNKESKLFQLLSQFDVRHKVLLTGTPLQNHIGELFMLLHFLEPEKFSSRATFEARFSSLAQNEEVTQLHTMLQPHMLRRLKKDVMKQLPPKMEQLVRVELSARQKEIYKSLLMRHSSVLVGTRTAVSAAGGAVTALKNLMMELRKACNHPFLVDHGAAGRVRHDEHPTDLHSLISFSGKLQLVDKMASRLRDAGHRLIIFSQFTRTLDLLEEWLVGRGMGYLRIDGTVSGAERQKRIDRFNQQPDAYFCFLLSTRAGGLGINLATADTVIIFDSDWNPHNDLQAQARAHRLGQDKPVMIYRLVTRQTIEERMMQVSRKKMLLEHLVVRKMSSGAGGELKQSELDDIIRYGAQELFADDEEEGKPATAAADAARDKDIDKDKDMGAATAAEAKEREGKEGEAMEVDAKEGEKEGEAKEGEAKEGAAAEGAKDDKEAGGVAAAGAAAAGTSTAAPKSKRIVWDDPAVDRLLDRQALNAMRNFGESAAADETSGDLFSAFKVANFDMVEVVPDAEAVLEEEPLAVKAAAAVAGAEGGAATERLLQEVCPDQLGETGAAFWQSLLQNRADLAAAEAEAAELYELAQSRLGKGQRERKKISYRDAAGEDESDSEERSYSQSHSAGGGGGGTSDSEALDGMADGDDAAAAAAARLVKRQRAGSGSLPGLGGGGGGAVIGANAVAAAAAAAGLSFSGFLASNPGILIAAAAAAAGPGAGGSGGSGAAAAAAAAASAQQQQKAAAAAAAATLPSVWPPPAPLPPLSAGTGAGLQVYGMTLRDRQTFISALMKFGLQVSETNPDEMYKAFAQRLPHRPAAWVREYCNLVIASLSEPIGPNGTWPNGLKPEDLLGAHKPNDVLERIGFMHLVRKKMAEDKNRPLHNDPSGKPDFTLACWQRVRGMAYSSHWLPYHDGQLLVGLLSYGFGQWQRIIKDSALGIKEPLRRELGIPVNYEALISQTQPAQPTPPQQQGPSAAEGQKAPAPAEKVEKVEKAEGEGDKAAGPGAEAAGAAAGADKVKEGEAEAQGAGAASAEAAAKPDAAANGDVVMAEAGGTAEKASEPAATAAGTATDGTATVAAANKEEADKAVPAAAPAPAPAAAPAPTSPDASSGSVTKERARAFASNESRWLTRRLSYISEALNYEFLGDSATTAASATAAGSTGLKIAPRPGPGPASRAPGGAAGAAAAGAQRQGSLPSGQAGRPGQPAAAAAAAALPRDASSEPFLANLLPVLDLPASMPAAERTVRRHLLDQYNMLVRTVAQIRFDTCTAAHRAAAEGAAVAQQAAARFRQQVSILEAMAAQMLVMTPPQGQTVGQAGPALLARWQQAAAQQQRAVFAAAAAAARQGAANASGNAASPSGGSGSGAASPAATGAAAASPPSVAAGTTAAAAAASPPAAVGAAAPTEAGSSSPGTGAAAAGVAPAATTAADGGTAAAAAAPAGEPRNAVAPGVVDEIIVVVDGEEMEG